MGALFGGRQNIPIIKPLPSEGINKGASEQNRLRQGYGASNNGTILTSPLGVGENENSTATLLGS